MKNISNIKRVKFSFYSTVFFSLLLLSAISSYGQIEKTNFDKETLQLINQLEDKTPEKRQEAVVKIHALGKEAIPELINNITNGRIPRFLLRDPANSNLTVSQLHNSLGLTSAYLVEFILGNEDFPINEQDDKDFIFGNNYVYWSGIIVNSKNKAIEDFQLNEIKLQYEKWWSENKNKNIETLRKDWSEGKKPLSQSEYKWQ